MIDLLVVWQKPTHCKAIFLQLKYKLKNKNKSYFFHLVKDIKKIKNIESVVVRWTNLETVIPNEVRMQK